MKWISDLVSGYVRTFHFIIICLLVTGLVAGGPAVRSYTSGAVIQVFHYPFALLKNTVVDLWTVNEDNQRLRELLQETTLHLNQYAEIERENERLRAILAYEPPAGYDLFQARVLSVFGTTPKIAADINRGESDSIRIDMPVINQQGLIGKVVSVWPSGSKVQLLTDPTHRVAARVTSSREMGIVKYRPREGMLLDNFPIQGEIQVGDGIISSGVGGVYPEGLIIGRVASVERPEEATFCRIVIEPAVDFNTIEELFVLRVQQP